MVGRFNMRSGDGDHDWMVWDNALNGQRGSGLAEQDAHDQAAELELQYDARGYRSAETVQRIDLPVPVERAWQLAGVLDAWVRENGEWIGRVRRDVLNAARICVCQSAIENSANAGHVHSSNARTTSVTFDYLHQSRNRDDVPPWSVSTVKCATGGLGVSNTRVTHWCDRGSDAGLWGH